MAFNIPYRIVVELGIWHHHWLDTGAQIFDLPPTPPMDSALRQRLLAYDLRRFIRLIPTSGSRRLLQQRGLHFKTTSQGCYIYARSNYAETLDDFRLGFEVRQSDYRLLDYSDIGVNTIQRQLFHLTNFGLVPVPRLLLTSGGNGAVNAGNFMAYSGSIVRIPKDDPSVATNIQIFDKLSGLLSPVLEFNLPANPDLPACELDCRSLMPGKYSFEGTNIPTTILYLGLESPPGLLGVIDIIIKGWEGGIFDARIAKKS